MKKSTLFICQSAAVAAFYVLLTIISPNPIGFMQIRFSESLCVLPVFLPASVSGLFIGCVLSNLILSASVWDIVFGSLATLAAAYVTYKLGKKHIYISVLLTVIINAVILSPVQAYVYGANKGVWFVFISLLVSEALSAGIIGIILFKILNKSNVF